ncbi:MAG: hypothetical protein IKK10_04660 [Clostridia bacterium]|nr:hypothetical protein [Clostridia bacterium]
MSNTDNIRKMYGRITAPEDAVANCICIEESKKVRKFPVKRVIAIAACLSILLAVAVPVGANKIMTAFEGVEEYGSQFPQKTETYLKEIGESSLLVTEGSKLSASAQSLEVKVEEAYFDGAYLYLSFAGSYSGDAESIDRFTYTGTDEYIKVNGEFVRADITGYSFSLFNTEDGFAGTLGLIYPTVKENLEVQINIPYLEVRNTDYQVVDQINENLNFNFYVKKSAPSTLVYNGDASREELSILGVTASKGGVCVEIFVPEEYEVKKSGIITLVKDEQGNSLYFILGKRELVEGGYIYKHYFEPAKGTVLDIALYDKNNMDLGELASLENVIIG